MLATIVLKLDRCSDIPIHNNNLPHTHCRSNVSSTIHYTGTFIWNHLNLYLMKTIIIFASTVCSDTYSSVNIIIVTHTITEYMDTIPLQYTHQFDSIKQHDHYYYIITRPKLYEIKIKARDCCYAPIIEINIFANNVINQRENKAKMQHSPKSIKIFQTRQYITVTVDKRARDQCLYLYELDLCLFDGKMTVCDSYTQDIGKETRNIMQITSNIHCSLCILNFPLCDSVNFKL